METRQGMITWQNIKGKGTAILQWDDTLKAEARPLDEPITDDTDADAVAALFDVNFDSIDHDGKYILVTA